MSAPSTAVQAGQVDGPPPGWDLIELSGTHFITANGPLFSRIAPTGEMLIGLRVEQRHCNLSGACHGGMLMTLADMLAPFTAHRDPRIGRRFLPTVSMSHDFLAPAPLGSWLVGHAELLRVTRNLVFAQGILEADGVQVLRTSGVFKLGGPLGDDAPALPGA